jgi:hypothetical protein
MCPPHSFATWADQRLWYLAKEAPVGDPLRRKAGNRKEKMK